VQLLQLASSIAERLSQPPRPRGDVVSDEAGLPFLTIAVASTITRSMGAYLTPSEIAAAVDHLPADDISTPG
jgi:hypothetical protein